MGELQIQVGEVEVQYREASGWRSEANLVWIAGILFVQPLVWLPRHWGAFRWWRFAKVVGPARAVSVL